jgi:hypothetical protein
MGTLGFVLMAMALAAFVTIMVRGTRRRRRAHRYRSAQQTGDDDSPTGYVQGVWLLGGADSAKSHASKPHGSKSNDDHDGGSGSSAGHSSHDGGGAGSDGGGSN